MSKHTEKLELIDISKLIPYANNARTHSDEQIKKIQASIREFGFVNPVLIDKDYGIIAGHGRVEAAKREGIKKVPCVWVEHLTEAQKKAYILADNRLALDAGWDEKLLKLELEQLEVLDFDISLTGFETGELKSLDIGLRGFDAIVEEDNFDEEEALNQIVEPKTKDGNIYTLGKHRLMCGDSTKSGDVKKLMNGQMAKLIITDPPYNVNYEGGTGLKIQNDNMSNDAFYKFLYDTYTRMYENAEAGCPAYIFHSDKEGVNFRKAFIDAGFKLSECLVWVKNSLVLGRQDYHWQHEPILYGWKEGDAHFWYGDRDKTTVIEDEFNIDKLTKEEMKEIITHLMFVNKNSTVIREKKPTKNDIHPTMKPLKLISKLVHNSSNKGDIVMDLFGGSGSTMMTCEQTNRICYMMELDCRYVQVIIERYINLTGGKVYRLNPDGTKTEWGEIV